MVICTVNDDAAFTTVDVDIAAGAVNHDFISVGEIFGSYHHVGSGWQGDALIADLRFYIVALGEYLVLGSILLHRHADGSAARYVGVDDAIQFGGAVCKCYVTSVCPVVGGTLHCSADALLEQLGIIGAYGVEFAVVLRQTSAVRVVKIALYDLLWVGIVAAVSLFGGLVGTEFLELPYHVRSRNHEHLSCHRSESAH